MNNQINILLIEDCPADAALVKQHLSVQLDIVFHIDHFGTLEEAVTKCSESNYDISLLALNLPDSAGLDNCLAFKAHFDCPFIALTNNEDYVTSAFTIEAGADDYLAKNDCNPTNLVRAIRYSLHRQKSRIESKKQTDLLEQLNYELEIKNAELQDLNKKLVASHNRFSSLFHNAGSGFVMLNSKGIITDVNQNALQLFGGAKEELLGMHFKSLKILSAKEVAKFIVNFRSMIKGKPLVYETTFINKKGEKKSIGGNGFLLRDEDGKSIGVAAIINDKTEEQKINKLYNGLILKIDDVIYQTDGEFNITYVNHHILKVFGYETHELIGKNLMEFVHPSDRDRALFMSVKLTQGEDFIRTVLHLKHKNGESRIARIKSTGKCFNGKLISTQGLVSDITQQIKREIELRDLNLELELRNEELNRLLYITSHDLRAPLVNINGFSREVWRSVLKISELIGTEDNLNNQAIKRAIDEVESYYGFLTPSIYKMDRLLDSLLQISRITLNKLNKTEVNLENLILGIVKSFTAELEKQKIMVVVGDLPRCYADEICMSQIFSSLLANSIKSLENIDRPQIKISGERKNGYNQYWFTDNGCGIPQKQQMKIFDLFYKLENSTESIGIGLSIIKRIIDLHKGKIWIRSAGTTGTSLIFTIPDQNNTNLKITDYIIEENENTFG